MATIRIGTRNKRTIYIITVGDIDTVAFYSMSEAINFALSAGLEVSKW
jgi:hypothetical protein